MLGAIIDFYIGLWHRWFMSHYYGGEFICDNNHPLFRRATWSYRRKMRIVKNFWIGAGLIVIVFPFLPLLVFLTLATTFVSFSILDETE